MGEINACQKTRMTIIPLFLPVNVPSANVVSPSCRIYKVLCNLTSLLPFPEYISAFIVTPLDEGRGVQRHFPRLSQEESGLSSDPYIPILLHFSLSVDQRLSPIHRRTNNILLPRDFLIAY